MNSRYSFLPTFRLMDTLQYTIIPTFYYTLQRKPKILLEEAGKKEQRGLETGPSLVSSNNSVL